MKLEDAKLPDGWFILDGCHHETAESLIQTGIMGFCGCGDPEGNLEYVRRGLEHIESKDQPDSNDRAAWDVWWRGHQNDEISIFGNSQSAYFFYYWADNLKLTEHGGSVPGWLTEKGNIVLELLRTWNSSRK